MSSVVTAVVVGLVWWGLLILLRKAFPCRCGRTHPPYYFRHHWKVGVMVGLAVVMALIVLLGAWAGDVFMLATGTLIGGMEGLAAWYHERDKIRRALKGAGRVVVTATGRLRVVTR